MTTKNIGGYLFLTAIAFLAVVSIIITVDFIKSFIDSLSIYISSITIPAP